MSWVIGSLFTYWLWQAMLLLFGNSVAWRAWCSRFSYRMKNGFGVSLRVWCQSQKSGLTNPGESLWWLMEIECWYILTKQFVDIQRQINSFVYWAWVYSWIASTEVYSRKKLYGTHSSVIIPRPPVPDFLQCPLPVIWRRRGPNFS